MKREEFKAIRKSFGFTQEALARRIGYSVDLVRCIEQGVRDIQPSMEVVMRLMQENFQLRNELRAYRTGDKDAIRSSNKQQRMAELYRQRMMIEDAIRREGDPITK